MSFFGSPDLFVHRNLPFVYKDMALADLFECVGVHLFLDDGFVQSNQCTDASSNQYSWPAAIDR